MDGTSFLSLLNIINIEPTFSFMLSPVSKSYIWSYGLKHTCESANILWDAHLLAAFVHKYKIVDPFRTYSSPKKQHNQDRLTPTNRHHTLC